MSAATDDTDTALAPVREGLLATARAEARRTRAAAEEEAAAALAAAQEKAARILDEARRRGEADGAAERQARLRQARRAGRRKELAVQREIWEALRQRAAEAATSLRTDNRYPRWEAGLATRLRDVLGPGAVVEKHSGGGVTAVCAGRRVDCSLPALAAAVLARLGSEVEELWTP